MTDNLASGLPWVLITIVGVIALGFALIYGIYMWRQRRLQRQPGSLERAPGPAPKGRPPAGDDRRAV
jgi:uncharacterized iron-regulated membrane protein